MLSSPLSRTLKPAGAVLLLLPAITSPILAARVHQQLPIVEPGASSAFWYSAGEVTIRTAAQPPLTADAGHELLVYLDHERLGDKQMVTQTSAERGAHEVYAGIVHADGNLLI